MPQDALAGEEDGKGGQRGVEEGRLHDAGTGVLLELVEPSSASPTRIYLPPRWASSGWIRSIPLMGGIDHTICICERGLHRSDCAA